MCSINAYYLQSKQTPSLTLDNYFILAVPEIEASGKLVHPVPTAPFKSFETPYSNSILNQLMDKFRHDRIVEKVEGMECFNIKELELVFQTISQWHQKMVLAMKSPMNNYLDVAEKSLVQLIEENGVLDTQSDGRLLISDIHQKKQLLLLFDNALVNIDERHKIFLSFNHSANMEIIAGCNHFKYKRRLYTLYQVQYENRMEALKWIVMYGNLDDY